LAQSRIGTLTVRRLIRSGDAQGWREAGQAACASQRGVTGWPRHTCRRRTARPRWRVRRRLYPS